MRPTRTGRNERTGAGREPLLFDRYVEESGDLFTVVDEKGSFVYVNRAAREVLGVDPERYPGLSSFDFVHPEDRERTRRAFQGWLEREDARSFPFENRHLSRTGESRRMLWTVNRLADDRGRPIGFYSTARELPAPRAERVSPELDPDVARELRSAVARAKEREATMLRAFDALGESASALVHEIKNPITAVNAALCAVASRLGEDHQTVLRELVERMQKLERMLRRALAFAGPLDLHLETCEVAALARSVAESFRERGEARGASLEVDAPLPLVVSVDPTRIAEVVRELLANAAEAAGSGGRVRISARPGRCETVRVDVDDDGLGLPDVPTEELFRPFFTTRPNATGLGLSISRVIARAHGAELRASSGDLGGARFRLELPSTVR